MRYSISFPATLTALLPRVAGICYDLGFPGPGAVCNVGPDSTANLALLEVVAENAPGECQAAAAPFGGQYYEGQSVAFTGADGVVSTVGALNVVSDVTPQLTGTYTFSYNVPHTSIKDQSPVTVFVSYSIPGFGWFATSTSVFAMTHVPTLFSTLATVTSTTATQIITESTSTVKETKAFTETPAKVTSTSTTGTVTRTAPTPTSTTTITHTPHMRTVNKLASTKITKTVTCLPWKGQRPRVKRQAASYVLPDCGPITITTVYTSTSTKFVASPTTVTDTVYTTETSSTTTTLPPETVFSSVQATITITPAPFIKTVHTRAPRPTITKTYTVTVEHNTYPLGRKTPLCGRGISPPPVFLPSKVNECPFPKKP